MGPAPESVRFSMDATGCLEEKLKARCLPTGHFFSKSQTSLSEDKGMKMAAGQVAFFPDAAGLGGRRDHCAWHGDPAPP